MEGRADSLEGTLRTRSVEDYTKVMVNVGVQVQPRVDFLLSGDEKITLGLFDMKITHKAVISIVKQFISSH